jgi:hypothetical protein
VRLKARVYAFYADLFQKRPDHWNTGTRSSTIQSFHSFTVFRLQEKRIPRDWYTEFSVHQ